MAAPFPARMPSGHLSGLLSLSLSLSRSLFLAPSLSLFLFVAARSCPWFVFVREAAAASDGKGTIGKLTTPRALTPDSEVGSRSARSLSPSSSSRDSRRVFSYRRSSLHPGYPSTRGSLPATPPPPFPRLPVSRPPRPRTPPRSSVSGSSWRSPLTATTTISLSLVLARTHRLSVSLSLSLFHFTLLSLSLARVLVRSVSPFSVSLASFLSPNHR